MNNYENSSILLQNLKNNKSISANELLDVLKRILEETRDINGKEVSESSITDETGFALGMYFLCWQLSDMIKDNGNTFETLPPIIQKRLNKHIDTIGQAERDIACIQEKLKEESKKGEEAKKKKAAAESKQEELDKEIAKLSDIDTAITAIEADIKLKEKLQEELKSQSGDKQKTIDEYRNTLNAISNAWKTLCKEPDFEAIFAANGGVESVKMDFRTYEDLRNWFDKYESALKSSMEAYVSLYQTLLKKISTAPNNKEEGK